MRIVLTASFAFGVCHFVFMQINLGRNWIDAVIVAIPVTLILSAFEYYQTRKHIKQIEAAETSHDALVSETDDDREGEFSPP
jgi:DNA topoisomerase IA